MNINNRIKEIRLSKGVTQRYILKKLNKHSSWLSQIESGHTDINAVDLMRIAEVLSVPIEEFFYLPILPKVRKVTKIQLS